MASKQILKMFHSGRNLTLTYSVLTALRQNFSQRFNFTCVLGNTRFCTYSSFSDHEQSGTSQTEAKTVFRKGRPISDKHKRNVVTTMNKKWNRTLTEVEVSENKAFRESNEFLLEEDSFGTLSDGLQNKVTKSNKRKDMKERRVKEEKYAMDYNDKESFGTLNKEKGKYQANYRKRSIEEQRMSDWKDKMHSELKHKASAKTDGRYIRKKEDKFGRYIREKEDKFSDSFGMLAMEDEYKLLSSEEEKVIKGNEDFDDSNEMPHRRLLYSRNNRNHLFYARKIMKKGKQGKVREAISILEDQMLVEDRVQPSPFVFSLVIGICGRVGYTKKAFSLFNKMKKMGLPPQHSTYVALFNACANSPWKEDGLKRAENLLELMKVTDHEPSMTTYKAMLKAFAFCGDIKTAFLIADQASRKYKLDGEFFNFLLMAAISDKEAGFRYAVQIWRMMRQKGIEPNLYQYNLLLRVTQECGVGDQEFIQDIIPTIQKPLRSETPNMLASGQEEALKLQPGQTLDKYSSNIDTISQEKKHKEWWQYDLKNNKRNLKPENTLVEHSLAVAIPDILNPKEEYTRVVSIREIKNAEDRMMLLGGMLGFIKHMNDNGVKANIITFNQLLCVLPQNEEAELELFNVMEKTGIKPDTDIFNLLIIRRNERQDFEKAKEVVSLIKKHKLKCNQKTFRYLAKSCFSKENALGLLQDMEEASLEPDHVIFGMLLFGSRHDFAYKQFILKKMELYHIQPDAKNLELIENQIKEAKSFIIKAEKVEIVPRRYCSEHFKGTFTRFIQYYNGWLQRMETQQEEHPWDSFRKKKDESEVIKM